jgi:aminoglycoside phosphotransferase (APT) family kinase protein
MLPPHNRAATVRPGEELDVAALIAYLAEHLPGVDGDVRVRQYPAGYSNLTYLVSVGATDYVLRRPPFGVNIATAHDMLREYRVLRGLARVYDRAPRPVLACEDAAVLGAPFYLMERMPGVVLRSEPPLPAAPPPMMAGLAHAAVTNLAAIHALDMDAAGLAELGKPAGYVARQVHGWARRYAAARTQPQRDLEAALAWLDSHQRADSPAAATLIHNDYKHDNLLVEADDWTRIVAVLDWEMATLGDPLMDLGTMLGYWLEPGDPPALVEMFGLTTLPGNPTREEATAIYAAASGHDLSNLLFYFVYGAVKVGVILQQLHARFVYGQSDDSRLAKLDRAVAACGLLASRAIATGRISGLS